MSIPATDQRTGRRPQQPEHQPAHPPNGGQGRREQARGKQARGGRPNGQSNGCVSFKDYNAFLQAFKRGEVKRLVVVGSLT